MSAHTPGPWRTDLGDRVAYHEHERRLVLGGPEGLTTIAKMRVGCDGVSEANARLIAAAPDLLEALRAVAMSPQANCTGEHWDGEPGSICDCVGALVRSAIAKAEGR